MTNAAADKHAGASDEMRSRPRAAEAQQGRGAEFILNTLEVKGPREPLHAFIAAASGPGFIDWRPDWYSVYEHMYFSLMASGAPSRETAQRVAGKMRNRFWRAHEKARRQAELDPHRAVFRFLSEDWSPWIALAELRRRYPELAFNLAPSYLEAVVPDGRTRRNKRERRAA